MQKLNPSILVVALTALLAAGCEKKIASVCEEKCSAADVTTCQTAQQKSEDTAEERGCEGEFEDYASCLDAHGTCTAGTLAADTACATEIKALKECTG